MRNLSLRVSSWFPTRVRSTAWTMDSDTGSVFVWSNAKIYRLVESDPPELVVDLSNEGYPADVTECVGLISVPDIQALLVALATGELIQVSLTGECEEVGCVAAGISDLCMSPDLELITMVTGDARLIVMTRDYTPLSETLILQEGFGEGEFVNVGWGKKETQFHGSEGKADRAKKVERGAVLDTDDLRVRASWRGDGQMLAVSFIMEIDGERVRKIRVFDRSGVLYSTSEDCPGLEHPLFWKPSGNLIGTTIRKPNKHVVAFFEKNGLQHGEFELREDLHVLDLAWNCDSTILAVWCELKSGEQVVQFWTVGNYHWYLKQSRRLPGRLLRPAWHSEQPNVFFCISQQDEAADGEKFHTFKLDWQTDTSTGCTEQDLTYVAVVDGNIVKVTPMREAVIPPPVSAYEIHFKSQVIGVVFPSGTGSQGLLGKYCGDSNCLGVLTQSGQFFIFSTGPDQGLDSDKADVMSVKITGAGGNGYIVKTTVHHLVGKLNVDPNLPVNEWANLTWNGDQLLVSLTSPQPQLLALTDDGCELKLTENFFCEGPVYLIAGSGEGLAVQLEDCTVLKLDGQQLVPHATFPRLCSHVIPTESGVLGLNNRFKLYLDDKELAGNVTSMWLHSHFLLVTTIEHRLACLPRTSFGLDSYSWEDAGTRRMERGARLVCAVPHHSRTVVQMPRGNLEAIQPRSLTLLLLGNLLDSQQFHEAFLLARRQRINLNILVDHNEAFFLDNIQAFVSQISPEGDHLNIFLAELQNEDVSRTLYAAQYPQRTSPKEKPSKIEQICEAVRMELERQDTSNLKQNHILPILGTIVKEGKNIEDALFRIKKLRDGGCQKECEDGLRFVLYSIDVNVLFDLALGTYDFDLVLMVAEKSQKDPKEYLPILNSYKQMPPDYMKYTIDKKLKRYSSALNHIAKCQDQFEECLELVQEQRLFKQAIKLFPQGSDNYKSICQSYGAYLDGKRYYCEASVMYERAGSLDSAVMAAKSGGSWQRAGWLARKAGWLPDQLVDLWKALAERLEAEVKGVESAVIWREWLQDPEEAIAVLTRTRCWLEAVRHCQEQDRGDLLETHVLPGLEERRDTLHSTIIASRKQMEQQVNRLLEVRRLRSNVTDDDDLMEDDRNVEDADLFSDTSSVRVGSMVSRGSAKSRSTLATRQTQRSKSSKNRRKLDKKMYSVREGSQYEDLGLMAEIHQVMSSVYGLPAEIGELFKAMAHLGEDRGLAQLQEDFESLLAFCDEAKPKVWPALEPSDEPVDKFGPQATVEDIIRGGTAAPGSKEYKSPIHLLEPHLRYPPSSPLNQDWKLQYL